MLSKIGRLVGRGRGARRVSAACDFTLEGLETRQLLSSVVAPLSAPQPYEPPMTPVLAQGVPAPNFTLPYLNRPGSYTLSSDPARVKVLSFFSTQSAAAQLTAPQIQEVYEWANAGTLPVTVLLIDINEPAQVMEDYAAANGLTLPILMDGLNVGSNLYDVVTPPVTYVIANGQVQHWHTGVSGQLSQTLQTQITAILDTPTLSIAGTTVSEAAGFAEFEVTLSAPIDEDVYVLWTAVDGSARRGTDYLLPQDTIILFAAGETTQFIRVPIVNDLIEEPAETFNVWLLGASSGVIVSPVATGTIIDDDTPPDSVRIDIDDTYVIEGDEGTVMMVFTVTMSTPLPFDIAVNFAVAPGGLNPATPEVDYVTPAETQLIFLAGETSKTIMVPVIGDTIDEPYETLEVTLLDVQREPEDLTGLLPVPFLGKAVGIGTIHDDEPYVFVLDNTYAEGDEGIIWNEFQIWFSSPATEPGTIEYATVNGTARVGLDFVGQRAIVPFEAGAEYVTILIGIVGDVIEEEDEYFFIRLLNSTGAALRPGTDLAKITILNETDAEPPTPTVYLGDMSPPLVYEGLPGATLNFTINLTSTSWYDVMVNYAVTGGTATPGEDYIPVSGTAVIPAGQTSFVITVPIIDDNISEANETLIVTLTEARHAILGNATSMGVILDDDPLPGVIIENAFMPEGHAYTNVMVFVVSLTAPSGQPVTVSYTTIDGTANATDYEPTAGTVTFMPGEISRTIRVPVYGDRLVEDDEHFFVSLTGADAATILQGTAVGTIIDDDRAAKIVVRTQRGIRIQDNRRKPPISFGWQYAGHTGTVLTFTVTNVGTRELNLGRIFLPAGFKLVEGYRRSLAPSESDTFSVQVLTNRPGLRAGHIRFATSDPAAKPFNFAVSARVIDTPAAQQARKAAKARATSASVLTTPAKAVAASLFTARPKSITAEWLSET